MGGDDRRSEIGRRPGAPRCSFLGNSSTALRNNGFACGSRTILQHYPHVPGRCDTCSAGACRRNSRARGGPARAVRLARPRRGEERPESDVDVVVDIEAGRKFSLIDLAGLHVFLSDLFGRETDVVIRKNLRPHMREAVEADAVPVF